MLFSIADGLAMRMLAEPGRDWSRDDRGRRAAAAPARLVRPSLIRAHDRHCAAVARSRSIVGWPASQLLSQEPPMQTAMLRLDRLLRRRKRVVLIVWAVDRARGGPVRGAPVGAPLQRRVRRSPARSRRPSTTALERLPGRAARASSPPCWSPSRGATPAQLRAAVDRVAGAARADRRRLAPRRRARAGAARRRRRAARSSSRCGPRSTRTARPTSPPTCASALGVADGARDGVATHLVGQGALWAAMQELSKEDLAKAESAGFPVVLLILLRSSARSPRRRCRSRSASSPCSSPAR